MDGTEITCGCYKTKDKSVVFPITEVVSYNEYFDYEAKYNGASDEITPARISDDLTRRVQTLTSAIYDILGAYGIIRVDYYRRGKNQSAGGEYHPRNDCHQLYSPAGSCCRNGDEGCNDRYYRKQV